MHRLKSHWSSFLVAVVAVMIITIIRLVLDRLDLLPQTPFLLFTFAVIVAGWRGGLGPALLALGLASFIISYLFMVPRYSLAISGQDAVALLIFAVQGGGISWMLFKRQEVLAELSKARQNLEHRVEERTHELEKSNQQLSASNRELQDFASVASHDLQEPLRKIQAFGDRLKSRFADNLPDDAKDYLERMRSAAGRMQVLIDDLLMFSRVTSKAQPFRQVDLNQIIGDVLIDLETRLAQTSGRVEMGKLPTIDADPLQMRQLFQNLISNGLKFRKADTPPVVTITATDELQPSDDDPTPAGSYCTIQVKDNGIGFEQKYADRIFTIFQRLHGRNAYEGTGIGLAICRKIVERHHGTIEAQSEPDQGALFSIRLPLQQPSDETVDDSRTESRPDLARR
jgi:light-regulated signal transduction histidine kinase (bacteriophytochrome)